MCERKTALGNGISYRFPYKNGFIHKRTTYKKETYLSIV